jgi:Xaa-Pro aminopeptidase
MKSYFSPVFFSNNRKKLKSLNANNFPIIVTANGLLQRGADSTYAFSQDANFWYLTGLDEPDLVLVMEPNKDYLIVPKRSSIRETFDGSISTDSLISRSGINDILDDKVGWDKLRHTVSKHQQLATVAPPPEYVEQYGFYTNPSRAVMLQHLKLDNNDLNIIDIGQNLARMRMLKQPEEIKAIQAAVDITIESLQAATKPEMIESYKFEYEMEAEIRGGFRRRGASGDSFEPIVAAGKNACTLHNVANNGKLTRGELLLADVGA